MLFSNARHRKAIRKLTDYLGDFKSRTFQDWRTRCLVSVNFHNIIYEYLRIPLPYSC